MYFDSFIKKIPEEDYSKSKIFVGEQIAIFEPQSYVLGKQMYAEEYQFIIHRNTPPPAIIGNKEYQFKKGNLTAIESGMDITVLPTENNYNCKYISICINEDFIEKISYEFMNKNTVKFKKVENFYSHPLLNIIENTEYEITNYGTNYPMMIQSLETQLCFQILRDINTDISSYNKNLNDQNYIEKSIEYMKSYYNSNITIEDISQVVHLSPYYFIRLFKEKTGYTPHDFLMKLRIEKAEQMIKESKLSMEEIANYCGFVNQGHFSTAFKNHMQMSPIEYRKKIATK